MVAEQGRRGVLGAEVKVVEADLGRVGAVLMVVVALFLILVPASVPVLADLGLNLDLVLLDSNIVVGGFQDGCRGVGGGWLGAVVRWFWTFSRRVVEGFKSSGESAHGLLYQKAEYCYGVYVVKFMMGQLYRYGYGLPIVLGQFHGKVFTSTK